MSRALEFGVGHAPRWAMAVPLLYASLLSLSGCGLDASGCAQSCASGCGECDALDGCGCTTGPIPGGFDRTREIDDAIQVRLGPAGLRFLEDNVEALAASALMTDEVNANCRDNMAGYKIPRTVVFGPLPKTSTGKIQKFVLRDKAKEM